MITVDNATAIFLLFTALLLIGGISILFGGRAMIPRGRMIAAAFLAVAGMGYAINLFLIGQDSWHPHVWERGWILPRDQAGAITIGVLQDPLGLVTAVIAVVLALIYLTLPTSGEGESASSGDHRSIAGVFLSTGGVALAWNSSTPWLAFFGITATVLGGFLAHGVRWDLMEDATTASRYLRERGIGLVLAIFGTCVLAGFRNPISFADGAKLAVAAGPVWQNMLGAVCLTLGLLIQCQPFPLLGSARGDSSAQIPGRILLGRILPAWAAFAILFRFEGELRAIGIFPVAGWVALGSTVLSSVAGLFQASPRTALSHWLSSLLTLVAAVLAFSGPAAAFPVMLCSIFASFSLAMAAGALDLGGTQSQANKKRAKTAKVIAVLAVLAGAGLIGFSSSGPLANWMYGSMGEPLHLGIELLAFLLTGVLAWKISFQVSRIGGVTRAGWLTVLSPVIPLLLSLGLWIDGTASGGMILDSPDALLLPGIKILFPNAAAMSPDRPDYPVLIGIYLGSLVVALLLAFWIAGRKADSAEKFNSRYPRLSGFIQSGYGVDWIGETLTRWVRLVGEQGEYWIGTVFWNRWVPTALQKSFHLASRLINRADDRGMKGVDRAFRQSVEVPSKVLQLIQNGDVQWYLFFGIGSGIALLGHFLRAH